MNNVYILSEMVCVCVCEKESQREKERKREMVKESELNIF